MSTTGRRPRASHEPPMPPPKPKTTKASADVAAVAHEEWYRRLVDHLYQDSRS